MKKLFCVSAGVAALAFFSVLAVAGPVSQSVTITGTVAKAYPCACVHVATYTLTSTDGSKVKLPTAKNGIKLDNFVGAKVVLTGVGGATIINGKPAVVIQKITAIVKAPGQA